MFYSETLLSKTGPLARVWLSANLERKLNKTHILQSSIETSVNAIVDQGQAPMALRLSGQLLLGVVRIYSRKARYLMDDCNDAILKIKMAFRPGNETDFQQINPDKPNPGMNLPDALAGEIQFPTLDESLFNAEPMDIDVGANTDPLNWTSQAMSDPLSIEQGRSAPEEQPTLYEDDLGLDLGLDDGPSIELGRDAPPPRSVADEMMDEGPKLYDDDLGLGMNDEDEPLAARMSTEAPEVAPIEERMAMDFEEHDNFAFNANDTPAPEPVPADPRLQRASQSPLSSVRSSEVRGFDDRTFLEEPSVHQAKQPAAKRRKVLPMDAETTIHSAKIKEQQNDRSAILKPMSILPKSSFLLTLMTMQQNGDFVSNVLGDGRMKGLAPQLHGLLSIETVRKAGALKRKRDSGVADLEENGEIPQIEIPDDGEQEELAPPDEGVADLSRGAMDKSTIVDLPTAAAEDENEAILPPMGNDDDDIIDNNDAMPAPLDDEDHPSPAHDPFDETTAPLLHPAEDGPISAGTQHAVHALRAHFGGSPDAGAQKKGTLFEDLYPPARTSRAEATQMFFETLVLATKDAVRVEQAAGQLGAPIRIRAKRSLWGEWAEKEAGGEIAARDGARREVRVAA